MIQILVLRDRWNLVGVVRDDGRDSGQIVLLRAHVIRYWGTTKGLGELVSGPVSGKTKLDALPAVGGELYIPYHALNYALTVDQDVWTRVLGGAS